MVREPAHVIDLLPTFLELAGAKYPGKGAVKLEGENILPLLQGGQGNTNRTLCWEHEGNRAIRKGNWKLVALGPGNKWELYDLATNRIESRNLADEHPEMVKELSGEYDRWAARCGVIDYPQLLGRRAASDTAKE